MGFKVGHGKGTTGITAAETKFLQRMPEARATKKVFKWSPLTTRPRGRPKYRWEDNIIQDLG